MNRGPMDYESSILTTRPLNRVLDVPLVLNIPEFWIYYQGSEYTRVLNIPGYWIYLWFWICQAPEYTSVLNMPGFWTYQDSEYVSSFKYISGSEYARVLNVTRFWVHQGSAYTSVLNVLGFWICQGYTGFCLCLINSWIYLNMS